MYIPNKPAKYGIKMVNVNDIKTSYILNAIPYLEKVDSTPKKITARPYVY